MPGWGLLLGLILAALGLSGCSAPASGPEFAKRLDNILQKTWESYKVDFISADGRVIRPQNERDSISEGQAYALLRAVWSRDQATFDRCYAWTEAHLSRQAKEGDHLLAWRWGQTATGQWQVLDWNSASDADLDYALALILAHRQWGQPGRPLPDYLAKARLVLCDILAQETAPDPSGRWWLIPGNWVQPKLPLLLNPSYFSPAWYRLFFEVTADRRWLELIDSTYFALEKLGRRLGDATGVGLFPDWCVLAAPDHFAPFPERSSHYGWEAVRIPWRVALDQLWFREARASECLRNTLLPFYTQQWARQGKLVAQYTYQGKPVGDYESPAMYAGVLAAALAAKQPDLARRAAERIVAMYHQEGKRAYFNQPDDYYGNNWGWLGLATYRDRVNTRWGRLTHSN